VNTSHTRRKRRLDEEYEQILCKIEMKREDLYSVEEEAKQLNTEKVKANDEMRKLEKSLVELLVEQQKTLFSISTGNDL
jgi:predicted nuclease with TOPRIM domain